MSLLLLLLLNNNCVLLIRVYVTVGFDVRTRSVGVRAHAASDLVRKCHVLASAKQLKQRCDETADYLGVSMALMSDTYSSAVVLLKLWNFLRGCVTTP